MRMSLIVLWSSLFVLASAARSEVVLEAPASVAAGSGFDVSWSGGGAPRDFVTLVAPDRPEGEYGHYVYAKQSPVRFVAPDDPGAYELRYLGKDSPYPTLARRSITVTPVTAALEGPGSVEAGGTIEVSWTGPGHERDFITVVEAGAEERTYDTYVYANRGNPARLTVPEAAGDYEVRYLTGQKYNTLARHAFAVAAVSASIEGPATATEGADFEVRFTGTGNERDFITVVSAGTPEGEYGDYAYVRGGGAVELTAPEAAGDYEIRYLTAGKYRTLARSTIEIVAAGATLAAPAEVRGGEHFEVAWTGVGNDSDYVTIVAPGAGDREYGDYAYVRDGSPVHILAPLEAGDYELRYALGASRKILARRAIRVTEPETRPGSLRVVQPGTGEMVALPEGAAVELILDASGSMLKRQGGRRRIDVAKAVLSDLVGRTLPPSTPFALRVFGHREADSCRSDLEIALSPLAAGPVSGRIAAIEAMNLAKTPIARSLELVAEDLAGIEGPAVVVLVTDGEETCGGDPAAAVEKLRGQGFDVRVNIVGFAIDDDELKSRFRYWADVGGGVYRDASSAADLGSSIRESLRAAFEVLTAAGEVVATGSVGGEALELPAGSYRIRVEGRDEELPVDVVADDLTTVDLGS